MIYVILRLDWRNAASLGFLLYTTWKCQLVQIVADCVLKGNDHMEPVTSVVLVFNDCVLDSSTGICFSPIGFGRYF